MGTVVRPWTPRARAVPPPRTLPPTDEAAPSIGSSGGRGRRSGTAPAQRERLDLVVDLHVPVLFPHREDERPVVHPHRMNASTREELQQPRLEHAHLVVDRRRRQLPPGEVLV